MKNKESAKVTEVKGSVLASIPAFIKKRFGKEGLEKWLDAISPEAHRIYLLKIETDRWYPVKPILIDPMANVAQLFFNWDIKTAAWEMGRYSADFSVGGVKKVLFRIGSTTFFLQKAAEFMDTYYRPAKIEVKELTEGYGIMHIPFFPQIERTIEYRIAGWVERVLEIAGNRDIVIDITQSLTEVNKTHTEILVSWK
jgi:hypothetical protein